MVILKGLHHVYLINLVRELAHDAINVTKGYLPYCIVFTEHFEAIQIWTVRMTRRVIEVGGDNSPLVWTVDELYPECYTRPVVSARWRVCDTSEGEDA